MGKLKQWLGIMAAAICIILGMGFSASAEADSTEMDSTKEDSTNMVSTDMDVVLVLDVSGSMQDSDPNGIALEGAKLFIDMMERENSKVGILSFSTDVTVENELSAIHEDSDKEETKEKIDNLKYSGHTDIGKALEEAVSILSSEEDDNKKTVVFFTDGNINLPEPGKKEAEEDSREKADDAVEKAEEDGIPIYTIGLNADGSVDEEFLQGIADNTRGEYHSVTNASELPQIFSDIFADLVDSVNDTKDITLSDKDTFKEVPFNIPNNSVAEANIVMIIDSESDEESSEIEEEESPGPELEDQEISDSESDDRKASGSERKEKENPLKDFQLEDPDGQIYKILSSDYDNIFFSNDSGYYSMLKIMEPAEGQWILRIQGDQDCKVHVNFLFNYEILVDARVTEDEEGDLVVSAQLKRKDSVIDDEDFLSTLEVQADVTRNDTSEPDLIPMTLSGTTFTGNVPITDIAPGETIEITVHAEGSNYSYDSKPPISISVEEIETEPFKLIKDLDSPIVLKGLFPSEARETVDLDNYFAVANEENYIVEYKPAVSDEDIVKAEIDKDKHTLKLQGVSKGSALLTVQAADAENNTVEQTVQVEVKTTFGSIIPLIIILILALLIILIVVILIIRSRKGKMTGYLYWQLQEEDGYQESGSHERYDLTFSGNKTAVSDFIMDFVLMHSGIDKVIISGMKNGIQVQNKSRNCTLIDMNGEETKKTKIYDGSSFRIKCQNDDGEKMMIEIRYQANFNDLDYDL